MNKVTVLVEGYAHSGENGSYIASPSTTLITAQSLRILVDPGTNRSKLEAALEENHVKKGDIDFIYLSHYHPDHWLNVNLFPDVDIYDGTTQWSDDKEIFYEKCIPHTDIQILLTPGHSPEHSSLLVNTAEGVVCIAQDVFWWEDGKQKSDTVEDLLQLEDPFATDKEALLSSRKLILEHADIIIPGHGKMFKNPNKS